MESIPSLNDWTDYKLDHYRQLADPPADQVVLAMAADGYGFRELMGFASSGKWPGKQSGSAATEFLQQTSCLPAGIEGQIQQAATEFFLEHGPKFLIFLYYKSLPVLYSCRHMAAVLLGTGKLAYNPESMTVFTRRLAGTSQFVVDVMSRDQLQNNGNGIKAIRRVRLTHAWVRHHLVQKGWNTAEQGPPVNQEDMAGTLLTFSILLSDTLTRIGIPEAESRHTSFIKLWAGIGQMLGVTRELLPENAADARNLFDRIHRRQLGYSPEGSLLARALVEFAGTNLPLVFKTRLPVALIYLLCGKTVVDQLKLPESGIAGRALNRLLRIMLFLSKHSNFISKIWKKLVHKTTVRVSARMKRHMEAIGLIIELDQEMKDRWR